jgi:hypothetical protein
MNVYTTTAHHFGQCELLSVHRKWPRHTDIELAIERHESGRRGDQATFHLDKSNAKRLCAGLLSIIGNDSEFHKELEQMMRVQRTPE